MGKFGACVITKVPELFSSHTLVLVENERAYCAFLNDIVPPPTNTTVIKSVLIESM